MRHLSLPGTNVSNISLDNLLRVEAKTESKANVTVTRPQVPIRPVAGDEMLRTLRGSSGLGRAVRQQLWYVSDAATVPIVVRFCRG